MRWLNERPLGGYWSSTTWKPSFALPSQHHLHFWSICQIEFRHIHFRLPLRSSLLLVLDVNKMRILLINSNRQINLRMLRFIFLIHIYLLSFLSLLLCLFLELIKVLMFFLFILNLIGIQIISQMFLFAHFIFYVDVNGLHVFRVLRGLVYLSEFWMRSLYRMGSKDVSLVSLPAGVGFHVDVSFRIFIFILKGSRTICCISWAHASEESAVLISLVLVLVSMVVWYHFNSCRIVASIAVI